MSYALGDVTYGRGEERFKYPFDMADWIIDNLNNGVTNTALDGRKFVFFAKRPVANEDWLQVGFEVTKMNRILNVYLFCA